MALSSCMHLHCALFLGMLLTGNAVHAAVMEPAAGPGPVLPLLLAQNGGTNDHLWNWYGDNYSRQPAPVTPQEQALPSYGTPFRPSGKIPAGDQTRPWGEVPPDYQPNPYYGDQRRPSDSGADNRNRFDSRPRPDPRYSEERFRSMNPPPGQYSDFDPPAPPSSGSERGTDDYFRRRQVEEQPLHAPPPPGNGYPATVPWGYRPPDSYDSWSSEGQPFWGTPSYWSR
ncbi:MAG: hypothetical protein HQL82_06315 [Magnetococcales bacterium]|nr:hypothetical protein [Magnetococcales bacterium]